MKSNFGGQRTSASEKQLSYQTSTSRDAIEGEPQRKGDNRDADPTNGKTTARSRHQDRLFIGIPEVVRRFYERGERVVHPTGGGGVGSKGAQNTARRADPAGGKE